MAAVSFSTDVLRSKFRGCMIGGLIGDCLGAPYEFRISVSKEILNAFFSELMSEEPVPVLKYTDDTSMTISVASSLINKGDIDAQDMAKKFVDEYFRQPTRGYGINVRHVFRLLRKSNFNNVLRPARLQFGGEGSYGNGAAMRIAPVALFGHGKGEQFVMKAAEQCACLTHTHQKGINGAKLQALAVNAALGLDSTQVFDPINFINNLQEKMENLETKGVIPYCDSLKTIREIFLQNPEDISPKQITKCLGNGSDESAMRSVPTAIYSFLRGMKPLQEYKGTNPFLRTLFFAITLGGDTDTIASMAGSIAGAYYGVDVIPEVLQRRCESIDKVIKLADELFDLTQKEE